MTISRTLTIAGELALLSIVAEGGRVTVDLEVPAEVATLDAAITCLVDVQKVVAWAANDLMSLARANSQSDTHVEGTLSTCEHAPETEQPSREPQMTASDPPSGQSMHGRQPDLEDVRAAVSLLGLPAKARSVGDMLGISGQSAVRMLRDIGLVKVGRAVGNIVLWGHPPHAVENPPSDASETAPDKHEPEPDRNELPPPLKAADRVLLVGGIPRPERIDGLKKALGCKTLEWEASMDGQGTIRSAATRLKRGSYDFLVLLNGLNGHFVDNILKPAAKARGVIVVHVRNGCGTQSITQAVRQAVGGAA